MHSYEREAYDSGLGLVYPLLFDYPDDENVADYSDAWMFGEWLLVAPITERGQSVKWIYLPEGTWIDYNRGTVYEGGQYIPYSLNSESWTDIPMFIKEGAIIPTQDVQDYVGQETVDHVTVDIFPSGRETSFRYYDDDGETYDYEDGVYFTQEISAKGTGNTEVKIGAVDGSHNSGLDYYYLAVHGQAATEVTSNGSLPYYDDYNALLAAPGEGWTVGKDVYGDVTYIKAYAASDSNSTYTLEGSSPVDETFMRLSSLLSALECCTDLRSGVCFPFWRFYRHAGLCEPESLRLLRSGVCRQAGSRWRRRYLLC